MLTVNGPRGRRERIAAEIRGAMLRAGYLGIVTEHEGECVTYDVSTIRRCKPVP
jgi:hypothetical protein